MKPFVLLVVQGGMLVLLPLLFACAPSAGPPRASPATPEPPTTPASAGLRPLPAEGPFDRELAPGLRFTAQLPTALPTGSYSQPAASVLRGIDPRIYILWIDPTRHRLELFAGRDPELARAPQPGTAWVESLELEAAWNPGMFEPDGRSTGYTRAGSWRNQSQVRRASLYRGWFVLGDTARVLRQPPPKGSGSYLGFDALPLSFRAELDAQRIVAQSLPILMAGRPAYPPRTKHWSELAYGVDARGWVAVVFTRYPYEMRALGAQLVALDLGLVGLIHGEGGPEATLVVRAGGLSWVGVGSYETGFWGDDNHQQWPLPAVMGARAMARP